MKNSKSFVLALIAMLFVTCYNVSAQDVPANKSTDKVLKDTLIKSVSYKLYLGSRGGHYILRTSKSGNVYKQYFKH